LAWHIAPFLFAADVLTLKPAEIESKNGSLVAVSAFFAVLFDLNGSVLEVFVYWLVHGLY